MPEAFRQALVIMKLGKGLPTLQQLHVFCISPSFPVMCCLRQLLYILPVFISSAEQKKLIHPTLNYFVICCSLCTTCFYIHVLCTKCTSNWLWKWRNEEITLASLRWRPQVYQVLWHLSGSQEQNIATDTLQGLLGSDWSLLISMPRETAERMLVGRQH